MNSAMLVLCTLTVNNLKISLAKNSIGNNIKAQNRNSTLQSSTGNHHSVLARTKETERQVVSKSTSERRSNKRAYLSRNPSIPSRGASAETEHTELQPTNGFHLHNRPGISVGHVWWLILTVSWTESRLEISKIHLRVSAGSTLERITRGRRRQDAPPSVNSTVVNYTIRKFYTGLSYTTKLTVTELASCTARHNWTTWLSVAQTGLDLTT